MAQDDVVIVLVQKDDQFAMLKRANWQWVFPSRKVEEGETPEIAAVHEMKQEAGIGIEVRGALCERYIEQADVHAKYILATYKSGLLEACEKDKFSEARWRSAAEILNDPDVTLYGPVRVMLESVNQDRNSTPAQSLLTFDSFSAR